MTKKRLRAPGYSVSTKGHSVLRRGTYGMPSSRRAMLTVGEVYIPEYVPRTPTLAYDTRAEESALGYAVSRANYASCAALDDSYDTHAKSRGRDQRLLSDATQAIVSSETHTSPKAAVASRRARTRPQTTPVKSHPRTTQSRRVETEVAAKSPSPAPSPASSTARPRSATGSRSIIVVRAKESYAPCSPRRSGSSTERQPIYEKPKRQVYVSSAATRVTKPKRAQPYRSPLRPLSTPNVQYRKPKRKTKAAIVASKVETEPRRRRPRSKFAQDKLRAIQREARGEENVYTSSREPTGGLHASRPPMPMPTDRKSIRDVDGFTKPRNVLSWQYRLESRMDPTDIIYKPGSFVRMREQVRDAHDKLDRHRQLLDRYISDSRQTGGESVQGSVLRKMEELEKRDPVSGSSSAGAGSSSRGSSYAGEGGSSAPPQKPVSELRRRLRKQICKSKKDPNYYRD